MEMLISFTIFKARPQKSSENEANASCVHLHHYKTKKKHLFMKFNPLGLEVAQHWEALLGWILQWELP